MLGKIKELIRTIILGEKANSDKYIKYLRDKGCKIGNGTVVYDPRNTFIDVIRPWLINIGNNVKIIRGVTILTHGYDWSVLRHVYHEMLGSAGKVIVGDNVFIGMQATILKGVTIGNNVIIGANSLVNKDIPDDVVVGRVPAKTIMHLEEYYKKRKKKCKEEAKELDISYYNRYKVIPPVNIFDEFFLLFLDDMKIVKKIGFNFDGKYEKDIVENFLNHTPEFKDYDDFIKWCGLKN